MRVAHLSDPHLGHRPFPRMERGGNLREGDLAATFHRAIRELARLEPDLVLLAGDLFDHPDPPATAFLTLTRGIQRLRDLLPGAPIVAVAGASDTPWAPGDPGPVSVLDAVPGVEAAAGAPRAVHLRDLDCHVLLVPHRAVVRPPFPELRPDPGARWNVLVLRGHPAAPETRSDPRLHVDVAEWDYIAIGGPHGARAWAPFVHAAGSLERVGADPWREIASEKGFLIADLAQGEITFHPIPGRPVVDLAPVRVDPGDQEAGTRRLRQLLEGVPGGVDGKLVRVRLNGDILAPSEGVSVGLLEAVRRKAAHVEFRIGEPPGNEVPSEAPTGAPVLRWDAGGGGEGRVALDPGLWVMTSGIAEELEWVSRALGDTLATPGEPASPSEARPNLRIEGGVATSSVTKKEKVEEAGDGEEDGRGFDERHGDWIEAAGDAEARALEWARERQEAESRLTTFRERARELRDRIRRLEKEGRAAPCPTCRRPLDGSHPDLLILLEDEWERIVQDGTWWKRRRAQLDEKPRDLVELERRALRLQAELHARPESSPHATPPGRQFETRSPDAVERSGAQPTRAQLRMAGSLLHRATNGILDGVRIPDRGGAVEVVDTTGRGRPPARGEEALVSLALEIARAMDDPREEGRRPVHLLTAGRSGASPGSLARLLTEIATAHRERVWLAVIPLRAATLLTRVFRGAIEIEHGDGGRSRLRPLPPGRADIVLRR